MTRAPILQYCNESLLSSLVNALEIGAVHDWAKFLRDAGDPGGHEYRLPFLTELRMTGCLRTRADAMRVSA